MKKIIIVGASSGIGFRLAQEYAEKGCRLGIAARREAPLNELANKYPGQISVSKIDIIFQIRLVAYALCPCVISFILVNSKKISLKNDYIPCLPDADR